jgi:hypothetical protein
LRFFGGAVAIADRCDVVRLCNAVLAVAPSLRRRVRLCSAVLVAPFVWALRTALLLLQVAVYVKTSLCSVLH